MAKRMTIPSGEVVYLVNPNRASVTTSGHQSAVRGAIPYNADDRTDPTRTNYFHIPPTLTRSNGNRGGFRSESDVWEDLANRKGQTLAEWYRGRILDAAKQATTTKHVRKTTRANALASIGAIVREWQNVHARFGLRCSVNIVKAPTDAKLSDVAAMVKADEKRINAARRAEAKRQADREREHAELVRTRDATIEKLVLPGWRAGGVDRVWAIGGIPVADHREGAYCYRISDLSYPALRIRPVSGPDDAAGVVASEVESSQGAIVAIGAVRALVRALPNPDTFPETETHITDKLGDYGPVCCARAYVRVGCHRIPWSEVIAFCQAAGIEYPH